MNGEQMPNDHRGEHAECSRTRGLIARVLEDRVTAEDRAHGATCLACGPVLARASKFDDELRRTAQGFVDVELPRGILDPGLSGTPHVSARAATPGLAGIFAAVASFARTTARPSPGRAPGHVFAMRPSARRCRPAFTFCVTRSARTSRCRARRSEACRSSSGIRVSR